MPRTVVESAVAPVLFGVEHLWKVAPSVTVAFDSETTGLQPVVGGLRLLQIGARDRAIVVIDCWELDERDWQTVRDFFATPRTYIAHNAVFDLGWLQEHGIYPNGTTYCTMLASKLLNNGIPNLKHGLGFVVQRYLERELSKELQASDWSAPVLSREQLAYAAADVQALLDLDLVLQERLAAARLTAAFGLECKCLPAMAQMQRTGLPFNKEKLVELQAVLEGDIAKYGEQVLRELDEALPEAHKLPRDEDGSFNLRTKAEGSVRLGTKRLPGFNINSPKQLVAKLTEVLGTTPVDKDGKPSASRQALRSYAADHSVVQTYLLWKRAEKRRQMVSALLEHRQEDGFIRAGYLQLGAESGRMSCVAGDTVLMTSRGDFTFEEYMPRAGDRVLTHVGRWMPVLRKLYRGVEQAFEVVTAEGGRLCCTSDHKLWTGSEWVQVADLSAGDNLGLFKELGSTATEHRRCAERVSERATSDGLCRRGHSGNELPQRRESTQRATLTGETESGEVASLVQGQGWRSEPYEGQEWITAPQLHRELRGPERVFNATGWQWQTGISTSTGDGAGTGIGQIAPPFGGSSHRWGHAEQQLGQPGFGNEKGSRGFTPSTTVVESIKPVGTVGVWDIEVEGDHSYALYGFVSHNCTKPNLQQVPRDIAFRAAAEAPEGWSFVCADFGQMELRLAAAIAQDETMIKAFQADEDLHTLTAKAIYGDEVDDAKEMKQRRQVAKSANFGLLFGAGAKGLREYAGAMGITMTIEDAQLIRDTFHATYSGIDEWQKRNAQDSNKTNGDKWAEVRIPVSGMRRFLPGDMNRVTVRCNTPVQGSGAAILKCALGKLWPKLHDAGESSVRLAAVVHDEVLLLVREGLEEEWMYMLQEAMESAESLWLGEIPALAEANQGKTWADAK
jgi:DNA polymerase I-like protein with 3'-5' exonuclease and polymerase domains